MRPTNCLRNCPVLRGVEIGRVSNSCNCGVSRAWCWGGGQRAGSVGGFDLARFADLGLSPYQRPQPTPDRPDASNPPLFAHLLIAVAVTPTLPACLDELSSVPLQDHQKDGKNTKGSTATRASKTFDGNPPDMNLLRLAGRDDDAPPIPTPTNCVAAAARATRPPTSPPAPFRCPE